MDAADGRSRETGAIIALVAVAVVCATALFLSRELGLFAGAPSSRESDPVDLSNDPPSGTRVLFPNQAILDGPLLGRRSLVIAMGDCTGCSSKQTDFVQIKSLHWPQVVFVYESAREELVKNEHVRVALGVGTVVSDAERKISTELNVLWTPRWYVIDEERRIVSAQRARGAAFPTPDQAFPSANRGASPVSAAGESGR
ncbi:MAG: hypothetical protein M3R13_01235 [Armatimonadota bacterium]|nr:hypothetical protein [Armatimonadota bacterium]